MCMQKSREIGRHGSRSGQSLIESCIVMALVCLLFMALLQISQIFAAKEVLNYAANKGARARTVGLNNFMVYKVIRVGSIANAGPMTSPDFERSQFPYELDPTEDTLINIWSSALTAAPSSQQYELESARIPEYLGAEYIGRLNALLDYERWDTIRAWQPGWVLSESIDITVNQDYPLWVPMHRLFVDADSVELSGECSVMNHSELYLQPGG